MLRLSLHPSGIAPHIENLAVWRDHILERLKRLNDAIGDPTTVALEAELAAIRRRVGASRRRHSTRCR